MTNHFRNTNKPESHESKDDTHDAVSNPRVKTPVIKSLVYRVLGYHVVGHVSVCCVPGESWFIFFGATNFNLRYSKNSSEVEFIFFSQLSYKFFITNFELQIL